MEIITNDVKLYSNMLEGKNMQMSMDMCQNVLHARDARAKKNKNAPRTRGMTNI